MCEVTSSQSVSGLTAAGRRAERFGNQSMGPSAVEGVGAPEGERKQWDS